ncbi:MAG: EpsG family protein [Bacteroidota bacterium]|nr:EpsG family protein [Bacteroidota bacterium]
MIYLLLFILILFSALTKKNSVIEDRINYNFLLLLFILLAGFRYRVGGDSLGYMDDFASLPTLSQLPDFDFKDALYDPLWYIFNALAKSIFDNFIFFQIVQAIIVNTIILWTIKKYSKYKYWTVLFYFILYYLYFNMEILRESLSVCVFLLCIPYLLQKKWIKYYLFAFIAFQFHSSAIILFFIPFLFRKLKLKYYILLIILLFVFTFYITPFMFFSTFYLSERIYNKAFSYTSIDINVYGLIMQFIAILPVIGLQRIRKIKKMEKHKFEYLMTAYVVIGLLSLVITGFYRFLNYLSIFSLIYMADTFIVIYKNKAYYFKTLLFVNSFVILIFFYQGFIMFRDTSNFQPYTHFYNRYFPYYSIFNEKIDTKRENLYFKSMDIW